MYFWISIGSNIEPEAHTGQALEAIAEIAPVWWLYPPGYTEPVGMPTSARFINTVLVLHCPFNPGELKPRFESIEIHLGRDRTDPDRSRKDRVCDIDILQAEPRFRLETRHAITEPYLQPVLDGAAAPAPVTVYGSGLPERPATIDLDRSTRHVRILDDGPQALIDRVEAPL